MNVKWTFVAVFAVVMLSNGCATTKSISGQAAESQGIVTGFLNKTMVADGKERAYAVYVPRNYDRAQGWPLIVFLHGIGERGNDGLLPTDVGIGHAIRKHPERFPCVVVFPQCPGLGFWDRAVSHIEKALEQTRAEYNIDPNRIYLTGISLGGYATWMLGAKRTDVYAALMPICGGGKEEDATALAALPIWAFHGAEDDVVKPAESRKMVEAVKKAGGQIKYTEIPKAKHNSWDDAYGDAKTIQWLLKQKK
ncbi:MAG: prolyl oligopeptidase family serine peptidase [Candidatus Hydrogenedentes bacterium]|nr:prolyl oligopeptidase family serine peptidase [Candidatus Hydrogenedentota bacterium]